MAEKVVNGFMKGMSKDVHYSLLDNQQYIHAENFRPISSGFNTTGAIENIKGNKFIGDDAITNTTSLIDGHVYLVIAPTVTYSGFTYSMYSNFTCTTANGLTFTGTGRVLDITSYGIEVGMYIIGGVEIRDSIILFTTNNTNSQILKLTLTGVSDSDINTLSVLFDDRYTFDDSTLDFDVDSPIKAIARYETPNVQKVYWTDGINPLRYINIVRNCTITGEAYTLNDYWGIDKFELLPEVLLSKPSITGITSGTISTGMVFYAYQLYLENGAESAISYISDPVHVVADNDYYTSDAYYEGDGVDPSNNKGFIVNINFDGNDSFDRLKLIRVHYESYNQTPKIYLAADIPIDIVNATSITLTDVGSIIGELTVDEFNITSSEIFICQELATKSNILFAANIEKKTFEIDEFDARAVRFKTYTEAVSGTDYVDRIIDDYTPDSASEDGITCNDISLYAVEITIENFKTWGYILSGRTVTDVTVDIDRFEVEYDISGNTYNAISGTVTASDIVYTAYNDTLSFRLTSSTQMFTSTPDSFGWCGAYRNGGAFLSTFTYDYTASSTAITIANPLDSINGSISITSPLGTTLTDWNNAGWINYVDDHDGINIYNNPDNDFDSTKEYKYQSNGSTLGAEGPNVIISFETDDFIIDELATTASRYQVGLDTDGSYHNYSSPLHAGELTWQDDEVYRLFLVFKNRRGQNTDPKWICDLRIPSMTGSTYGVLTSTVGSITRARRVYPSITIRDGAWPTDAVSAQVYRVPRNKGDRQVITQCLAYPFEYRDAGSGYYWYLANATEPLSTYDPGYEHENLVKLVSPEINITKNIGKYGQDYLEYVSNFNSGKVTWGELNSSYRQRIVKCTSNTVKTSLVANDRTDIVDTVAVMPLDDSQSTVSGQEFVNYNDRPYINAKGSSGLVVKYSNNSWTAEGTTLGLINYKTNCWNSQYGGLTYENKQFNNMIPCSDVLYEDDVNYNCEYGDTFINYFDVSTLLYDMTIADGNYDNYSKNEAVYVPLKSSINCNLRAGGQEMHKLIDNSAAFLIQEELGVHSFTESADALGAREWLYNQVDDMYKYNTVYSQQPLIAAQVSIDATRFEETIFDTQIRASNVKINGEYIDSWTKFGVNESIEVDSLYGPVNAILEYGNTLYFWQDKSFGILAVNDRSLIQDNNTSKLVLGTGGVLDRFDYISTQKGCEDKFSVVGGVAGVYWIDRLNRSINRFSESLSDLALQKGVKSLFTLEEDIINWPKYISVQDKANNEILFTVANYENGTIVNPGTYTYQVNRPFTLCFNETMDVFTSEYTFKPFIYIPFKNTFLTSTIHNPIYITSDYPANLLFIHDVDEYVQARNNFYGLYYNDYYGRYDSEIDVVFNPFYLNTKVFDNMFFNGEVRINSATTSSWKKDIKENIDNELCPIQNLYFWNDYQEARTQTLTYKTNLERRERTWSTTIPRNVIKTNYGDQTLNPFRETIDPARTDYQERLRGKYLVCKVRTKTSSDNTYSYRIVLENLGVTYRNSYR